MDEIERIPPTEGAELVTFDYAAAESAVAIIRAVRTRLGDCGGGAVSLRDEAVVNWHGGHRIAFDEATPRSRPRSALARLLLDQMRCTRAHRRSKRPTNSKPPQQAGNGRGPHDVSDAVVVTRSIPSPARPSPPCAAEEGRPGLPGHADGALRRADVDVDSQPDGPG